MINATPERTIIKEVEEDEGYLHLSWGQLKKYCSDRGLNVKGKKRVDLIEELEAL